MLRLDLLSEQAGANRPRSQCDVMTAQALSRRADDNKVFGSSKSFNGDMGSDSKSGVKAARGPASTMSGIRI